MMQAIDGFLNKITMYRLILYALTFLALLAAPLSLLDKAPFSVTDLIYSIIAIFTVSFVTNKIFAWAFNAPTNVESVYISSLILVLIITPSTTSDPASYLSFICWVSALTMASKYILAIGKKHIFNPVAIALVIAAFAINESPSWWVGTSYMAPFVAVAGFLVVRKIRRTDLVLSFLITAILAIVISGIIKGSSISPITNIYRILFQSPVLFLAVFMLTEPLTTPPTRIMRIMYGVIVGLFFIPDIHIGSIYPTPEIALVLGNIFAYLISPKEKLFLTLKEKLNIATDTYEFSFTGDKKISYLPGQYLEWTLKHRDPDSRGNRRYFTIASSPTEDTIKLGIKFYPELSSFKNKLLFLKQGDTIVASQCAGEFILPKDVNKKLVFIAGGIGVTPFRSMIKYCIDKNEKRDIVLLYSNKTVDDIAYKNIFDEAEEKLGIKTIYAVTDQGQVLKEENMRTGFIDSTFIQKEIPNYKDRIFYISGPHTMVSIFEKTLAEMGIPKKQIKTDFFPGFA
ncbi:MAG: RnfABCDGE type electron transport complex subunit D [Candidatus Paceibacterota bacterium]|jgi:ferredoxin-NADP reductase